MEFAFASSPADLDVVADELLASEDPVYRRTGEQLKGLVGLAIEDPWLTGGPVLSALQSLHGEVKAKASRVWELVE